jgi:hypothetical protein
MTKSRGPAIARAAPPDQHLQALSLDLPDARAAMAVAQKLAAELAKDPRNVGCSIVVRDENGYAICEVKVDPEG